MEEKIVRFGHIGLREEWLGGVRYSFEFNNSYGASVIRNKLSYGHRDLLWELAVIKDGRLCYSTEITDDVIGYLSEQEVEELLNRIEKLQEEVK